MVKRISIILGAVVIFSIALSSVSLASGYKPYESTSTAGTVIGGYTRTADTQIYLANPHGGYSATSNKCKTCHAVHGATGTYKLLRATSADDACDFCHVGAGAHTDKLVYGYASDNPETAPTAINNGHTIGHIYSPTSPIPDSTSTASSASGTLVCNRCHSVHGANAISFGDGKRMILRNNPLDDTTTPPVTDTASNWGSDPLKVVQFCQKCHNANSGSSSHPYAAANNTTAWADAHLCSDCHNAQGQPHAAIQNGYKMLTGRSSGESVTASNLDDVCLRCHLDATGTSGVGQTF